MNEEKSGPEITVVSCSLKSSSRSRLMAQASLCDLSSFGIEPGSIDLAEISLPFCDGDAAYTHEKVAELAPKIAASKGMIIATPIYNYDVNAALKNLIELTGRSWTGKVIGFLCAAGGQGSYMSVMALANSLILDFRCVLVPRFVYATGNHFEGASIIDTEIRQRITALTNDVVSFTRALDGLTERLPEP